MTQIIQFIASHSVWFYAACALGIIIFLVTFLRAQQGIRRSLFGLEIEIATLRQKRALRSLMLTLLLGVAVFLISTVIEPNLPAAERVEPTATPDFFASPPPTFTNLTPTATATLTPTLAMPTITPQIIATSPGENVEEETPTPAILPPPASGTVCIITSPTEGSEVSGEIVFRGTATTEQFLFYKLEAFGPQTEGVWASILGDTVDNPVVDGILGSVNFGGWIPGGYSIRVVIVDTTSNEVAACLTNIRITSP